MIGPKPGQPVLEFNTSSNEVYSFEREPLKADTPVGPESYYLYENDDGTESVVRVAYGRLPPRWAKSSTRPIKLERLPEPFEKWDRENDCWVKDNAGEADFETGPQHKEKSHIIKSLEARLIKVGLQDECFLLVKEAQETNKRLDDLVNAVLENESKFIDSELKRRKKKEI